MHLVWNTAYLSIISATFVPLIKLLAKDKAAEFYRITFFFSSHDSREKREEELAKQLDEAR